MKPKPAPEMTMVRERITPEIARKYLEANYDNRPIVQSKVDQHVNTILRGQWKTTHQGVAFDVTGRLVDGQHRLTAIAQSGRTVEMWVGRDLEEGSFRVIDCGQVRKLSARLKLTDDVTENAMAVSIARSYCAFASIKSPEKMSPEVIENQFLGLADEICAVARLFRKRVNSITSGGVGAAIALYWHYHPEKAREFAEQLLSGTGLEKMSPVLVLREGLVSKRISGGLMEGYWKTIQATKFHERGTRLSSLAAASEDWAGNTYEKLKQRRSAAAEAGDKTKKAAAS